MYTWSWPARGGAAAAALAVAVAVAVAAIGISSEGAHERGGATPGRGGPTWSARAPLLPAIPLWRPRSGEAVLADAEALLLRVAEARGEMLALDSDLCGRQVLAVSPGAPLAEVKALLLAYRVEVESDLVDGRRLLKGVLAPATTALSRRAAVYLGIDGPVPDEPDVRATKAFLLERADARAITASLRESGVGPPLDADGPWIWAAPSLGAIVITDLAGRLRGWERRIAELDGRS